MNSSQVNELRTDVEDEHWKSARSRHDIRASLAITKGFCQALQTSFEALSKVQLESLSKDDTSSIEEQQDQLNELQSDCQFCLSRIMRSLNELDSHLVKVIIPVDSTARSDISGVD